MDSPQRRPASLRIVWLAAQTLLGALLGLVLLPASLKAQEPQLIPQPREMATKQRVFRITGATVIALAEPTQPDDSFAAQSLEGEIQETSGQSVPVVSLAAAGKSPAIVLGRFNQPAMESLLRQHGLSTAGVGDQGYVLDVEPSQVVVAGKDAAGLYYGVQTLRQLIVPSNQEAAILGARGRDWPALAYRGTQVDLSRGPVPTLAYLERIVRTIAEFKMNALFMYMEDSFPMAEEPLVGVLTDKLSVNDWKKLVAYAAPYHVEIIPTTEACGHLHKILRFEEYSSMAERPHGHVLAPGDPNALSFLDQMYSQMAAVFSSPIYHIGCDETVELGLGRSADAVLKEGYGKVYVDNLIQVTDLVKKFHKRVMFWGDVAVQHPEMIPRLPSDLWVASWEYSYHRSYQKWVKPFEGTGMKIFVCPWVASTNLIVPDNEEAAANIGGFLADGRRVGAIGTDVTIWSDDGQSLYGLNWWGIVYGAASAWEPERTDVGEFNRKYDWAFYRNTDHRFAEAINNLGHLNEVLHAGTTEPMPFKEGQWGGAYDSLFWRNPFTPAGNRDVQKELPVASFVRLTAEKAYTVFAEGASRARRNADTLQDYQLAALRLDALGMRYQFAQEISERYATALAHQNDRDKKLFNNALADIQSTNGRLQDLRDYTTRLRELYQQRWLSENLPGWLPNVWQLYDRDSQMWQGLIVKFSTIRSEFRQGQPLPSAESLGLLPSVLPLGP
jgi:hexosaminidase